MLMVVFACYLMSFWVKQNLHFWLLAWIPLFICSVPCSSLLPMSAFGHVQNTAVSSYGVACIPFFAAQWKHCRKLTPMFSLHCPRCMLLKPSFVWVDGRARKDRSRGTMDSVPSFLAWVADSTENNLSKTGSGRAPWFFLFLRMLLFPFGL